ncbi:MAG TPA: glycosyltransferase family 4 protein [Melioribacteraceae bacterium]|nr:glycosyltransferase family 4 protein [Melioribacteraceae bacterium]
MNILFLTLFNIEDINERGIYNDLLHKFADEGHNVYAISPNERRYKKGTEISYFDKITVLKVFTLNIQKTNIIEKGIGTLLIETQFLSGLKKYFYNINFDLILYSTPPITFTKVIKYVKKKNNAKSYLLLKDIFPQNAVDLGMTKFNGFIYNYFRKKEKELYNISDFVGCMSPANVKYLIENNKELDKDKIEVNPNSIKVQNNNLDTSKIVEIKERLNIPQNSVLFLYGGNLGLPQGIEFLLDIIEKLKDENRIFFLIIGSGTKYKDIKSRLEKINAKHALLLDSLPKNEYDNLVNICDVGMIFLDKRFTIPNFPSRILSYLEAKKPVLLCTDKATDIGTIAETNSFGLWSLSGDLNTSINNIFKLTNDVNFRNKLGNNGYNYLISNYTVNHSYNIIIKHFT